jgi:uncharacterized membrane protein
MTKTEAKRSSDYKRIFYALIFSSIIAIGLLIIEAIKARSGYYYFLIYNMGLAYIPLLLAWWLTYRLQKTAWLSFSNILLTILWIGFLPNSFYMITDLIHTSESIGIDLLYNIVLIILCIFNALVAGYISLYLVHWALLKRFYYRNVHIFIALILLICSFAIYLGRFLRWNSWDVIINPAGILFDVSDSIASPSTHPQVFSTTASFFVLLTTMYIVIWQITRVLRKPE